jgi:two-component system response regulator PilR (NtrC family)
MEVLMEYDFPGNVRELENIIERGVALESSNIILPESLALSLHKKNSKMSKEEGGSEEQGETSLFTATMNEEELFERGMEDILTGLEKKIIAYALDKSGNSKMKAAGLLKISFRSLRYKTKKYGLS